MNKDLLSETIALVQETRIPFTRICGEIGVTTRWLYKLLAGKIDDPGVRKIQRLHDFLIQNRDRAA